MGWLSSCPRQSLGMWIFWSWIGNRVLPHGGFSDDSMEHSMYCMTSKSRSDVTSTIAGEFFLHQSVVYMSVRQRTWMSSSIFEREQLGLGNPSSQEERCDFPSICSTMLPGTISLVLIFCTYLTPQQCLQALSPWPWSSGHLTCWPVPPCPSLARIPSRLQWPTPHCAPVGRTNHTVSTVHAVDCNNSMTQLTFQTTHYNTSSKISAWSVNYLVCVCSHCIASVFHSRGNYQNKCTKPTVGFFCCFFFFAPVNINIQHNLANLSNSFDIKFDSVQSNCSHFENLRA